MILDQPGINVNLPDADGNTPLHLASFFNEYEIALMLCTKGADITIRNNLDQRPIILSEDDTMIKLLSLMDKKMTVESIENKSRTASLHRLPKNQRHARWVRVCV